MEKDKVSLTADNVSVIYSNGFTAIRDISFELRSGTICALIGVNGGGKSTLFKSIMGLVKLSTGSIILLGLKVKEALKNNHVAYVPQSEDIDWDFPILVKEVVMQGRYSFMNFLRYPSARDKEVVTSAMERMGVNNLKNRQIGELSGGQRKRVFLARALAQKSKIILLDEPFTGVDFTTENTIMELLLELKQENHLILVSTHNLGSIPEYCNEVIFINRTIIGCGDLESTFTQSNLEATFGGVLKRFGILSNTPKQENSKQSFTIISDHERPAVFHVSNTQGSSLIRNGEYTDA